MSRYAKAITALVTAVIGWGGMVVASKPGPVTAAEWLSLAVAAATALGVFSVPNSPKP